MRVFRDPTVADAIDGFDPVMGAQFIAQPFYGDRQGAFVDIYGRVRSDTVDQVISVDCISAVFYQQTQKLLLRFTQFHL